jgi:dihydrolipoamide dehydrogenase
MIGTPSVSTTAAGHPAGVVTNAAKKELTVAEGGHYDIVVLGGGSGGYACALRAAEFGKRVALIEKDKVGGTCLHRGCIPTKALLHAAEIADAARESEKFGIKTTLEGIDVPGVLSYQQGVVDRLWKGLQSTIASRKIDTITGHGRLISPTAVQVDDAVYTGDHIVLATGSVPKSLPGLELDGTRVITSDEALRLDRVPSSAIILGGGVIGVEFASVWKSFGADVTIVEMLPQLLPLEEESSSKTLQRLFRRRGITAELGARFESVRHTETGVEVTLAGGKTLQAEVLLVAVGRGPVSAGLGYEENGVAMTRGYVDVDPLCQTSVPTISAVGDLIDTPQLAHVGFAEGIMVAERIGGLDVRPIDYDGVPRITYSEPEVASVGITTKQAAERGIPVKSVDYPLGGNGRSVILGTQGSARVIAEATPSGVGRVLGIHLVGSRVGELIAEGQLIYNWDAEPIDVASLIHPHPTQSEIIGEAHLALAGKPLHFHA